ncbi:hypothetical protein RvY_07024 [Ramazzottius varieornatus]|uniref:Uncharacterized protein n=1 Tax=Ramazzottius varieornatus TaxID=947166 RepID=A0A1D1V0X8_RAMVA|nr:hypothetical protein RvY_07024 [Ramazzottius varieornatus]
MRGGSFSPDALQQNMTDIREGRLARGTRLRMSLRIRWRVWGSYLESHGIDSEQSDKADKAAV